MDEKQNADLARSLDRIITLFEEHSHSSIGHPRVAVVQTLSAMEPLNERNRDVTSVVCK